MHLHGQLGELIFSGSNGRPYGNTVNALTLSKCLGDDGIQIISEADASTSAFVFARNRLNEAQRVAFLGFGYDATNIQRLEIPQLVTKSREHRKGHPHISGSTYGLMHAEVNHLLGMLGIASRFGDPSWDALSFLRNGFTLD